MPCAQGQPGLASCQMHGPASGLSQTRTQARFPRISATAGRKPERATVVSSKAPAEQHEFPGLKAFGRVEANRKTSEGTTSETKHRAVLGADTGGLAGDHTRPMGHRELPALETGRLTPRATERITVRVTSPLYAAVLSTSCAETPRGARSPSSSSEQAGMTTSSAVFSMT